MLTGEVVDKDGNKLSDLHALLLEGVAAWEQLLKRLEYEEPTE